MNKLFLFFIIIVFAFRVKAQDNLDCQEWMITTPVQLHLPAFAQMGSVDGEKFDQTQLLENAIISPLAQHKTTFLMEESFKIPSVSSLNQMVSLEGFLYTEKWINTALSITSNGIYEVYVDGKKCKTVSKKEDNPVVVNLKLQTGKHHIVVKALSVEDNLTFHACFKDMENKELSWSVSPKRTMTIHDLLDGAVVSGLSISASGDYGLIKLTETESESGSRHNVTKLIDINTGRFICTIKDLSYNLSWLPKSNRLSYLLKKENSTSLFIYDIQTGEEQCVSDHIGEMRVVKWSPNEDFVILSKVIKAEDPGDLKRVFGNDDRMIPGYRDRSSLYYLNVNSGLIQPLTAGYLSANLNDISPDGSAILFSTTERDYQTVPFSKQNLYELNLKSFQLDTIWKDKLYGCYCQYSPDGSKLLAVGAAPAFGEKGVNITNGHLPNSFDSQMYLYDPAQKKAEVLTHDFPYSVERAEWFGENTVFVTVTERDSVNLYAYNVSKKSFKKFDLPVEVLSKIDFAKDKELAIISGTSISTPEKVFAINLKSNKSKELAYPKKEAYDNISFGKSESWEFENKKGTMIDGRVYYPVNYDPSKKYPVIVYYYGGTVPTERSFGGRYPKNIWTANGYMVYVLQPSGATGYGQNFSALHVNGWGKDAIDDIIDGTKEFLNTHPSADADNVGCIGASYGGFTTMMLQTRTDIFKTAIAHAGISDISSYWGEGFWGYSYSSSATTGSYPWNRRDIYVDNSPLFNADKFQNSILLLHGTADTNVPVGESLQYYAALKLLGKDVELVLIDGEDHHILNYKKRIKWNDTIISWFDKVLKNQPEQWNDMYPDKKL